MSKNNHLNRVLVIDLEATCWRTREEQGDKPNEIIEIGVCALNVSDMQITDKMSIVVKPRFTEVSEFCTELTGWTQFDIDQHGVDITAALGLMKSTFGLLPKSSWFSCGQYDQRKLSSVGGGSLGDLYGLRFDENPFSRMQHFNVKTLFALKRQLKRELGMDGMLNTLGLELEGRHHNGADDAYNIAKIVKYILS